MLDRLVSAPPSCFAALASSSLPCCSRSTLLRKVVGPSAQQPPPPALVQMPAKSIRIQSQANVLVAKLLFGHPNLFKMASPVSSSPCGPTPDSMAFSRNSSGFPCEACNRPEDGGHQPQREPLRRLGLLSSSISARAWVPDHSDFKAFAVPSVEVLQQVHLTARGLAHSPFCGLGHALRPNRHLLHFATEIAAMCTSPCTHRNCHEEASMDIRGGSGRLSPAAAWYTAPQNSKCFALLP